MKILAVHYAAELPNNLRDIQNNHISDLTVATTTNERLQADVAQISDYQLLIIFNQYGHVSGIDVLRQLRRQNVTTLIMFVSTQPTHHELVESLWAGADEHITATMEPVEIVARIRALARRHRLTREQIIVGDLTINVRVKKVTRNGRHVQLGRQQYNLLELLGYHKNRTVPYNTIAQLVESNPTYECRNAIKVIVKNLRDQLSSDSSRFHLIENHKNVGYRLIDNDHT